MESIKNTESTNRIPLVSKDYKLIDKKYICFRDYVIGTGSFGKVLYGIDVERQNEFAIKFEKPTVKHSVLKEELKIYLDLKDGVGIPQIYWYGKYKNNKIMVMDLLGPSLDKFFKICEKRINLESTVNLGIQMIHRIEFVHSHNILHRDIKPNNFLLGKFNKIFDDNILYIVDFGLSKEYVEPDTGEHYEYREDKRFVGTPRYASINTHMGIRQSRRDDLQSIAYVLIYFLKGDLPWQGIKAKTKSERKEKIKNKKISTDMDELCTDIPKEFGDFFVYTKQLKFEEKPDYDYIVGLLNTLKEKYNFTNIPKYIKWDWNQLFFKAREKNCSLATYSMLKKKYEKLYEGYSIPSFEDYLSIIVSIKMD
jgi:casein kinase 1